MDTKKIKEEIVKNTELEKEKIVEDYYKRLFEKKDMLERELKSLNEREKMLDGKKFTVGYSPDRDGLSIIFDKE